MTGYKAIKASDPDEQRMRDAGNSAETTEERDLIAYQLSKYLWERSQVVVAADRKRYPKAKRNAAVGSDPKQAPLEVPVIDKGSEQ